MAKITLKGTPVHTSGQLPALGNKAPDFKLVDGELHDRSLADYQGKRKLLNIVPSLDTAVCALSTKKFNEALAKHPEIAVLVISADLPFAQKRFCSAEHTKNVTPLSMMRSKDFGKDYGVLILDGVLAGLLARSIVILDEHNNVIYTEQVPEIGQEPNYEKALQALL